MRVYAGSACSIPPAVKLERMLLLTGPAGSGKSWRVAERFREFLRRNDSSVRLPVPTATMARHLQNRFAREGFVFKPGLEIGRAHV